jgi:serine phosphatase RsbU (regulator of sigma subunit)
MATETIRRPAPEATPTAAEEELLASQRDVFVGGRWVLFAAELATVVLRLPRLDQSLPVEIAIAGLLCYNLATLWALRRFSPKRLPAARILAADVVAVGTLVVITGGIESPFGSLFFLLSLVGALYYDVAGGVLVALAACLLFLAASAGSPGFWEKVLSGRERTQLLPYLLLHGVVAGYLVSRLKRLHQRRVEFEGLLRRAQYEEELRRREAQVAREIQRAVLPGAPRHPRFEIAVRFEPAHEVGGDFYAFLTDGPRLGVVIGDVSGKGVPAALISTTICHLSHCLPALEDPPRFLAALNADLLERLPDWTFATLTFVLLDPEAERLAVYNAGHPPPLVLRAHALQRIERHNLPLGAMPGVEFVAETARFARGDTLLLYSDGFIEVRNAEGRLLTLAGWEQLAQEHDSLPPEELAGQLVDRVRCFGTVTDDLTLVVVRAR